MYLIYEDGCYGRHRYGPVHTVLQTAEKPATIHKLSSSDLAQITADLLTLPQEQLLAHQVTSLTQFLTRYGRSRLGARFDRLLAGCIVQRWQESGFCIAA